MPIKLTIDPELADILNQNTEEITASWVEAVRQLPDTPYKSLTLQELQDAAARGLDAIVEFLSTRSLASLEAYLTVVSKERLRLNFSCGQITSGLLSFKDAILAFIWPVYVSHPEDLQKNINRLDVCLREIVSRFSELYTREANQHLRIQQEQTTTLLEMVRTASSTLDLDGVLSHVARSIVSTIGMGHCGFFLVDEQARTFQPKFEVTVPDLERIATEANLPSPMGQLSLDHPHAAVFRHILEERKPVLYEDAQTDPRFDIGPARSMGYRSILAIPFEVKGRMVAIAWVVTFDEILNVLPEQLDLVLGLAGSASLAIENAQLYDESHKLLTESLSMQQATAALLQERELDQVLDIVCAGALKLTGASGSGVFLIRDDFLWVAHSSGENPPFDRIPLENSFNGEAIRTGKSIYTNSPASHPLIYKDEKIKPPSQYLVVPLKTKGKTIGVLDLVNKKGGFTDEDVRITEIFADQVALAIENARLNQQVEQLVVIQERNRLSREIHDDLAPSLGALQLRVSLLAELIEQNRVDQARRQLTELQELISETYISVREDVFNLRAIASPDSDFISSLREYLADYQRSYGVQVSLDTDDKAGAKLAGQIQVQAIRIIQEALNNVRKHAGTNRARVSIKPVGEQVMISILDEGRGFDPSRVSALNQSSFGLQVMRERAESVGGDFSLEARPGQGTKIMFMVPITPNRLAG
ncbi:MAG: GAF domain-containing protein [Anaerolineales bacterium]|nr:GAF domain-containing protein [Anaerolineales bacterium]